LNKLNELKIIFNIYFESFEKNDEKICNGGKINIFAKCFSFLST